MKKFNVTGLCVPEKHYMVDISEKIQKTTQMIDEGQYFTIKRARQFIDEVDRTSNHAYGYSS